MQQAAGIRLARRHITPVGNWCQGAYARDAAGNALVESNARHAVKWCVMGALDSACASYEPVYAALDEVDGAYATLAEFNDGHSHAEVLALLDRAVEIAGATS